MRVLVVDDEYVIRHLVRAALGHCEVLTAADGASALGLLRHAEVDAMLLDITMPGMDGHALLRRLRSDDVLHDLPIIVLTGRIGEEDRVRAFRDGADAYLTKPFTLDELDDTLVRVIARTPAERAKLRVEQLSRADLPAPVAHPFEV